MDVGDAVGKREGDFLNGGRAGFADVIAGDGDGVPLGEIVAAPGEDVGDDAHGGADGINVGAAGDVFLEDVVLYGAGNFCEIGALLFGDGDVEAEEDGGGGVDGHGGGDFFERDIIEESFHVFEGIDGYADFADFAESQADGRSPCRFALVDRKLRRGRLGLCLGDSDSAGWIRRRCRSRRIGAWSRGGRGTWWGRCRGCRGIRRGSRWTILDPWRRDRLGCRGDQWVGRRAL